MGLTLVSSEFRRRWYPLLRCARFWADVSIILCIIIGGVLAKPAYHAFRDWRIERIASDAVAALKNRNYTESRRLASAVLKLRKDRYDMLDVLHRSMVELHDPDAYYAANALMAHPAATEGDRIRGFTEACASLPLATVLGIWQAMDKERGNSPVYLIPLFERVIDQGLYVPAAASARLLLSRADVDKQPELRLQAVRILLGTGSPEDLKRAQSEITDIMRGNYKQALPAFRLLAGIPLAEFRSAYFQDLEAWISHQEYASTEDRLLALIQPLQRHPEQAAEIARDAIARFAKADPAAVARWLLHADMAAEALTLLPEQEAASDSGRFRARADALVALKRWQDARDWLEKPPGGFPLIELLARRVICDDTPGDPSKHGKAWMLALQMATAKNEPNDLLELQQRLHHAGLDDLARQAMVAALRKGHGPLPIWGQVRDLLPWMRQQQQGLAMMDVCTTMANLEPANVEVLIESLDLACIFGKIRPSAMVDRLHQLEKRDPKSAHSPRFREAMATALLLDDQPDKAIAVTAGVAEAGCRCLAIRGVAKAMIGEFEDSSRLLERVAWKEMLREEKDLFARLLGTRPASAPPGPIATQIDP